MRESRRDRNRHIRGVNVLGLTHVELTWHAQQRMKSRGIADAELLATIKSPNKIIPTSQPDLVRARKIRNARIAVDVVYKKMDDRILVITAIRIERRR